MTPSERRAIGVLSLIFALRLLGVMMVLPLFTLMVHQLPGATLSGIGLALGCYGLSQGCLQIPLGWLSDHLGRKPVMVLGLMLLALGSLVAGAAHSIVGLIIGRTLQGAGAIGSTIMASVTDYSTPQDRTKAMALVGMSVGLTFSAALVLGPVLAGWLSLTGLFYLTAGFAGLAILLTLAALPPSPPAAISNDRQVEPKKLRRVLAAPNLQRLNIAIATSHAALMACFVALPTCLKTTLARPITQHWQIYLPVVLVGFIGAVPGLIWAEKTRRVPQIIQGCLGALGLATAGLALTHTHPVGLMIALCLFFIAFTTLEALLPSWASKQAPTDCRGTALGCFSSSQFLGIFLGGTAGGFLAHHGGTTALFISITLLCSLSALIKQDSPDISYTDNGVKS